MRFATFSIAGTFLAAVLIMAMWPAPARFGAPSSSIAQDDSTVINVEVGHKNGSPLEPEISANTSVRPDRNRRGSVWSPEAIDKKLQLPVDFDFVDTTMGEVMDEIRDEYGFNILLDESARVDLDEDTLITFKIKDVRLSTALRLLLQRNSATYAVQDGVLKLISLDVAGDQEFLRRKIFDCRELLASLNEVERERIGTPIGEKRGGSGGLGGGVFNQISGLSGPLNSKLSDGLDHGTALGRSDVSGVGDQWNAASVSCISARQGGATGSHSNEAVPESSGFDDIPAVQIGKSQPQTHQPPLEQFIIERVTAESILIDLITTSVDPESWDSTNGYGTLSIVGGFMVVNQTQQALDEIGDLLSELENRMKRE